MGTPPSATNVVNNTNTSATLGGTTASGDIAVIWYGCDAVSACALSTAAPLSGYTSITSRTGGAQKIYLDWKAAGASESDPTVTRSVGSTNDKFFGAGIILRGANTTTPVHASTNSAPAISSNALATPALTITEDNTYVCMFLTVSSNVASTAFGSYNPNGTGAWTRHTVKFETGTVFHSSAAWCTLQTTAASIGASSISITGGTSGQGRILMAAFSAAATAPTFSVSPAIGTRTTSSIPVTATTACTDCTFYGVAVTDGSGAPTCDQIEAQTATGGYKYFSQSMTATVQGTGTFTSYTDGTVRDGYFCLESTADGDSSVSSIADMYKLPAWTTTPNVSARAYNTHTISYQLDGPGTAYVTGAAKGKGASTYAQCAAGQDSGGAATTANNESTSGAADSIVLTYSSPLLVSDLNACATYGSQQSSVTTLSTEVMGAESGYTTPIAFASLCTALPCPAYKYNLENATDIIDGDYFSCTSATDPDALATSWDAAGYFSYSGSSARQLLYCKFQDVSAFGMFAGANPAGFYINNQAPVYSPPTINTVWRVGDVLADNECNDATDAEGDTLTGSNSSTGTGTGADKRPAGTSFGGTNNCVLSGTLTDVASGSYTFTVTDIAGDTADRVRNWEVRAAQETVPDCVSLTLSPCEGVLISNYLYIGEVSEVFSTTIAAGEIISQSPAAGSLADPDTAVDLVISKGRRSGVSGSGLSGSGVSGSGVSGSDVTVTQ